MKKILTSTQPASLLTLLVLFAISLSGCGSSDDEYEQEQYADFNDDTNTQYNEIGDDWRTGRLTLVVEFQHSGSNEETKANGGFVKADWKHSLTAQFEQKVELGNDLTEMIEINASMSPEELEERFGNASFSLINESSKSSGTFSYESEFLSHTPNSTGPDWLRDYSSGSGSVNFIDIDHFEISRFGKGYEFELELAGDGKSRTALLSGELKSDVDKDVSELEFKDMSFEDEFKVYPKPNKDIFDLYPELDSLSNLPEESRDAFLQMQNEMYQLVESYYTNKTAPHLNDFAGAVTQASKDKLVVKYVHDGHSIISRHSSGVMLVAPPNQNVLNISITIEAD